ncbi:MAG: ATP-binding cassette domain-containing protein [Alphaproteobacteria bacterium]|nr:ATP-binding cassette domain-containing protein [Alphaproteobacteria bacterium]
MSEIFIDGISRFWGPTRALEKVTFRVESGRFAVLLGPSGCGKSTLLRIIAGLDQASDGRIHIAGSDVTDMPPAKRGISMVFQSYALFPHLTVAQNICFGLEVRNVPTAERKKRLDEASELLGLTALLDRKPSQLSGGQQQRVALGRAIVAHAPVCLMDEPLSNLDAQLRQEMRLEIRELQRRLAITMLYVTHDQVEAMTMADQVILLNGGRVEQDGTPDALYGTPRTIFAARFLGTPPMNVINLSPEGAIEGSGGPPLADGRGDHAIGIRPEDIRVTAAGRIGARVETVEYLGADTLVGCRVGNQAVVARLPGRAGFSAGDGVSLDWPAERQHMFERSTGQRIDARNAT